VVSDGRVVQVDAATVNVHFGVRAADLAFVTGYVDPASVPSFAQLIGGIGWLVRNGTAYVTAAAEREGLDASFVALLSARSAIGHDAEGRLVHVEFDGKTEERGIDLPEFARLLVDKYALVNAINLDGGGSVTHVTRGIITSNPSYVRA
jgi:N-acetylglucosamine-1-phosphodiester alpha-N-acetylglucosaminidase